MKRLELDLNSSCGKHQYPTRLLYRVVAGPDLEKLTEGLRVSELVVGGVESDELFQSLDALQRGQGVVLNEQTLELLQMRQALQTGEEVVVQPQRAQVDVVVQLFDSLETCRRVFQFPVFILLESTFSYLRFFSELARQQNSRYGAHLGVGGREPR